VFYKRVEVSYVGSASIKVCNCNVFYYNNAVELHDSPDPSNIKRHT